MVTGVAAPTLVEQLARFAARASYDDLSAVARDQLKIRVLDALACAIGALDGDPVRLVRAQVTEFDSSGPCSLIGGGSATPDRAAFYNSALVRYLDFNDSYLAPGETCHPSDNLGAVLAAAEYAGASGRDFLAALALAYQVQCRLSDVAPVRAAGFDHVTQGAYAVAAGVARALGLDPTRTAHAIAIAGTAFNALRVTRTGPLSHWKGLAYPNVAGAVTRTTFLAGRGITGPLEVFEGEKGFMDAVAGYFELNWDIEDLERVTRTILKKYNAEIHAQSVLEAIIELRAREHLSAADVERVEVDVFDVAYRIIGGGEEGDKTIVRSKEEADHSLPYLVAVALLDGEVMPEQYRPARIRSDDVQTLLLRVVVRPDDGFSRRFPAEMPCRVRVTLRDGRLLTAELADYPGFLTRGRTWEVAREKFERLGALYTTPSLRDRIAATVAELERFRVADLTSLLTAVHSPCGRGGRNGADSMMIPIPPKANAKVEVERVFDFLRTNPRSAKPRQVGLTEIRGPYYSVMGPRYLADVLETMGPYVDSLKFAGGSFTLMPRRSLTELIELSHRHEVAVSTGGFIERVLTQGSEAVDRYIRECRDLGFDIIEISSGFITLPADDWLRLVERVQQAGLKAKPEVGIQFGAGGATRAAELEQEGTRDADWAIQLARRFLDAGAYLIMIESEGITENVKRWRTDVPARIVAALGLEHVMFEAADPDVFAWYVKNYGPEVNLFVDHSQIVQLECLRAGIWGTADLWGKVVTYKG